jgi:poly(3-hydroxyalkanoate) depolymerase
LPQANRQPRFEHVTVEGRTVRVALWRSEAAGTAGVDRPRPLLFFNGIGANIELMAPLADWLDDRDVLTFDFPGIGRSPSPTIPYRPWMMARVAAALLDRYGMRRVDVMGVSWGGCMAQQFAFQYPQRTGKLLLAATSAGMLMVPGTPEAIAKMASPRRYMDRDFMLKNFKALYGGETSGSDDHAGRLIAPTMQGYMYQLLCMAGWTSAWFLPFLNAPTLIMMGSKDAIVPVANGHILKSLIPKSTLHVVEGGGHLFLVSRAATVIPAILSFYDGGEAWEGTDAGKPTSSTRRNRKPSPPASEPTAKAA